MIWRFENSGFRSGAFNMEEDVRLARELAAGRGAQTVRVYGWKPPAISLGWHQSADDVDAHLCARAGIDVVRRPTGGRAVLHWRELTYSVVMPSCGKNVLAVYREISEAIVAALRNLGAAVSIERAQPQFPSLYRTSSGSACYASSARYEIQIGGRKLVGSAQRRFADAGGGEVILQHGSILLGEEHKRITEFLRLGGEEEREALRSELDAKTIDLSSALGRPVEFDEVAGALRCSFREQWGITFEAVRENQVA